MVQSFSVSSQNCIHISLNFVCDLAKSIQYLTMWFHSTVEHYSVLPLALPEYVPFKGCGPSDFKGSMEYFSFDHSKTRLRLFQHFL